MMWVFLLAPAAHAQREPRDDRALQLVPSSRSLPTPPTRQERGRTLRGAGIAAAVGGVILSMSGSFLLLGVNTVEHLRGLELCPGPQGCTYDQTPFDLGLAFIVVGFTLQAMGAPMAAQGASWMARAP